MNDARSQAVPFRGDTTAHDKAWAARVQAAFESMDVLDPAGLDAWTETHATSSEPHLAEAALVAVWEHHLTHLGCLGRDASAGHDASTDPAQPQWTAGRWRFRLLGHCIRTHGNQS